MAVIGRPPKPTALKILQGNPGKRPLNKAEPKPRAVAPKCPSWLPKEAKKKWKEIAPELERLGLLTSVDGMAFTMLLMHWAVAVEAAKQLSEEGLLFEDSKGKLRKNPLHQVMRDHSESMKAYLSEFGLTPSSRVRLQVPQTADKEEDPIRALLGY